MALVVATILICTACLRTASRPTPPAPAVWPREEHCWWAAYRTTMPADSVANRFAQAFAALGLSPGGAGALGDTAWAQGGPTTLPGERAGIWAARVVAIRSGDTTFVRPFVAADASAYGTEGTGANRIAMCGEIMRRAAVHATAPREQEPDDSSARWRRRP